MTTEWSLDFCLVCDRQTLGGPYCSQSCRLAELDVSHEPSSYPPETRQASKRTQNLTRNVAGNIHHSVDGASYQNSSRSSYPRALSPSSSQTSLSSLKSNSSSQSSPIAFQFQNELRDYASCFDQVRDLKRRLTA